MVRQIKYLSLNGDSVEVIMNLKNDA